MSDQNSSTPDPNEAVPGYEPPATVESVTPAASTPTPPEVAEPGAYAPPSAAEPPAFTASSGFEPPVVAPPAYTPPSVTPPAYTPHPSGGYEPPAYSAPSPGGYQPPAFTPPPAGGYEQPAFTPPPTGGYEPPAVTPQAYTPPPVGGYQPPPAGGYSAPAASGYTPPPSVGWIPRALGGLIDYIAPGIVIAVVVGIVTGISPDLGNLVNVVLWVGWFFLYLGYKSGTTGVTFGRSITKTKLVSMETGQPIGVTNGILRQLAHIIDSIICYIGWLFPLWDAQKQTIADKLMKTVVIDNSADPNAGTYNWG